MPEKLHIEASGHGPDLFLIHGWGLHSGVWQDLMPALASAWRVTRVDLPGHGLSRAVPMPGTLTEVARLVAKAAPPHAVWLGWSLGGLVALRAALDFPARLRGLILVSSTMRFVSAEDWTCGMPPAQLAKFTRELQRDYRGTVRNFLALQVQGDAHARQALRRLRALLFAAGEPEAAGLESGLAILRRSDLRAELGRLDLPVLVMTGGRDRLTPPAAGRAMASMIAAARLEHFPRAAHAPFLSHPQQFVAALREFRSRLPDDAAQTQAGKDIKHG